MVPHRRWAAAWLKSKDAPPKAWYADDDSDKDKVLKSAVFEENQNE